MAKGLYARVANRGFPSSIADGMTGAGALDSQGAPVDPSHGDPATFPAHSPYLIPQTNVQDGPAEWSGPLLEGTWGLAGSCGDPTDPTPGPDYWTFSQVNGNNQGGVGMRSHAAPFSPGWAGSYSPSEELNEVHANSEEIHGGSPDQPRARWHNSPDSINEAQLDWVTETEANDPGEAVGLAPLTGVDRGIGRQGDAVQGYDLRNRYGFDAGHRHRIRPVAHVVNAYLDPGERPFIVPQAAGSFTPTDAVQGPEPWSSMRHGENINYNPPTSYVAPIDAETTIPADQLAPAAVGMGWWS